MSDPVKKTEERPVKKEALSPTQKKNLDETKRRYRGALEQLSQL
jgi:hypothetical protein